MLNALRLNEGFTSEGFEERTGLSFAGLERRLGADVSRGMIEAHTPAGWRATPLGRRFLNDLIAGFLPDAALDATRQVVNPI
jgi:oxygen-independent coproporphyrinogen-3 oxidase